MNIRALAAWRAGNNGVGVARQRPPSMTRRQFGRAAAGTAVLGGTLGSGLFKPGLAEASNSFGPIPIPAPRGSPFHVFGPVLFGPADLEPSTITNLNGFVGLAYLDGMVTQTNTKTGEILRLPFVNSDMRFMKGNFRGTDGDFHRGTFALV